MIDVVGKALRAMGIIGFCVAAIAITLLGFAFATHPTNTIEQVDAMHSNETYTGPACGHSISRDIDKKTVTITTPKGWSTVHNICE